MSTNTRFKTIADLPSPKSTPVLGHLPQFNIKSKHLVLEKWVKECGDLFKIHFVGKSFLVSANPSFNEQILKARPDKFKRYHKIAEIMEEMGIIGVFNAEGDVWSKHRKPAAEALALKKVKRFYPIIANKTKTLLSTWENYTKKGIAIDVQKELMKYTVDITTEIAFGYKLDTINNQENDFQKHLELIFPMINERITAPLPLWRYFKRKKDVRLERSLKAIEELIHRFIIDAKIRLKTQPHLTEKPSNFLEALLVEQAKDGGFSDKEVYGNVFTMLLAGEDTTSNSISWSIYYLAQHPKLVKKIREEAILVYGDSQTPSSSQDLNKLKLANAVAIETMRLKPVTPTLYMEAIEDVCIDGFEIPKSTVVMLQNKVAQTEEKYFYKANKFNPERWTIGGCPAHENHNPDVIKVFGGGSRYCPGKHLAMHEMAITISSICKHFNFELAVKKEEIEEAFAFTMFPENLWLKLEKVT